MEKEYLNKKAMLKVEIVKTEKKEDGKTKVESHLIIDSIEDVDSYYIEYKDGSTTSHLYSEEAINQLEKYSFKEIGNFLDKYSYEIWFDNWPEWNGIEITCKSRDGQNIIPLIEISLKVEHEKWNKLYTLKDFANELEQIILSENDPSCTYYQWDEDFVSNGFGMRFSFPNPEVPVQEIGDGLINRIEDILGRAIAQSINRLDSDIITTFFNFPEHIKTPCKQYLVYFSQFLLDIGIEADTEIKEEAHSTLFKITPKDSGESLERIREALQVYLNAPDLKGSNLQLVQSTDISVMQWQANVMHLQSQVLLANSVLEAKNATIESLQLTVFQQRELLSKRIPSKESDKEEEVIGGIISVKKYEGKGISINFAEILRRLKRTFK